MSAPSSGSAFTALLPWIAALLVLTVVGVVVIAMIRRFARGEDRGGGEGFTLHALRTLHARGELSDEEFERARRALIERTRGGEPGGR